MYIKITSIDEKQHYIKHDQIISVQKNPNNRCWINIVGCCIEITEGQYLSLTARFDEMYTNIEIKEKYNTEIGALKC